MRKGPEAAWAAKAASAARWASWEGWEAAVQGRAAAGWGAVMVVAGSVGKAVWGERGSEEAVKAAD